MNSMALLLLAAGMAFAILLALVLFAYAVTGILGLQDKENQDD